MSGTGYCDCSEQRERVRELEAELILYKRVAKAARERLEVWTIDTYNEMRDALDALPESE